MQPTDGGISSRSGKHLPRQRPLAVDLSSFDHRLNYKRVLERAVEQRYYSSAHGRCMVHVLYECLKTVGTAQFHVRTIIRHVTDNEMEYMKQWEKHPEAITAEQMMTLPAYIRHFIDSDQRLHSQAKQTQPSAFNSSPSSAEFWSSIASSSLPSLTFPMTFSVRRPHLPPVSTLSDLVFPPATGGPTLNIVEQKAAFLALKGWNRAQAHAT